MKRFFAGLGLLLALVVLVVHGGRFAVACLAENNTCLQSANDLEDYSGRLFDTTGRPLASSTFGVALRSFDSRLRKPRFFFQTDVKGRFCFQAPRGDFVQVFVERKRSSALVDPRFRSPNVLASAITAHPGASPLPILLTPPDAYFAWVTYLDPRLSEADNAARTELWRSSVDDAGGCPKLHSRAPWWQYRSRGGDWRATGPLILSLVGILLFIGAGFTQRRDRRLIAAAACLASYAAFVLFLFVR